jgi:hypothetical protein
MKKISTLILCCLCLQVLSFAQDEEPQEESKGFKKENLFSGGSIALSFFNQSFLIGANPVLGYSLAKWVDLGIVVNYTYTSYRDYRQFDDALHQSIYGGGFFTRLYPVRFLFAQAQVEHNWIQSKYIPPSGQGQLEEKNTVSGNSYLVGAGYTTGRDPDGKNTYGYFAILWDLSTDPFTPYQDYAGRAIPIIRAGVNVPLFQGQKRR